jgi:excisionase family DNA binding protein
MIVTLTESELDAIIERAVERVLEKQKPAKLSFSTAEAAAMLGVPESWLAAKARARKVPFHQAGHYRLFSLQDVNAIMAQLAVSGELTPQAACDTTASHKGGAGDGKEKEKPGH